MKGYSLVLNKKLAEWGMGLRLGILHRDPVRWIIGGPLPGYKFRV